MISQSDILIAIVDRNRTRLPGDALDRAIEMGKPVFKLDHEPAGSISGFSAIPRSGTPGSTGWADPG